MPSANAARLQPQGLALPGYSFKFLPCQATAPQSCLPSAAGGYRVSQGLLRRSQRCCATGPQSCLPQSCRHVLQLHSPASPLLQARIEEVGQGLLRRTQEASGLGLRRKGQRSRFHMDAYEEHMLLPEVGWPAATCIIPAVAWAVSSHRARLLAARCMDTTPVPAHNNLS